MSIAAEALQYDIEALRANCARCDRNIQLFEETIEKERQTKKQLRQMIEVLEADLERKTRPDSGVERLA